jgi:AcrR family transcriptional regulator
MPSKSRRTREREATHDRILDAARELFVERGVEATTMRAIAERLECTAPAIYHHFADKQSLLRELVTQDLGALGAVFQRLGAVADPVERLIKLGLAYVRFGLEHPQHYRLLFMTPGAKRETPGDTTHPVERNPESDAYGIVRTTVTEAIQAGRFAGQYGDPERVSQICWAAAHGLISLHMVFAEDAWIEWRDVETSAERMLGALVKGMME